jgi:Zn-dependent peptidase ImmA (M78 family)
MSSLSDVASSTGIDAARLESIENGQLEPTGDEVLILADYYRCDFKHFISNERLAPFEQTETLYRAHGDDFKKEDRRAMQDFLYLCETEAFLMKEIGVQGKEFAYRPSGTNYKANGVDAAAKLRIALGHPAHQVSRDIYSEFRSYGVHVFRRKLGNSNISGVFIMHPTAGKCALINLSEDVYRQRFSAAHEMAHAIFDAAQGPSVSFERKHGLDLLEVRANSFASNFLMPPDFLARLPRPSNWSESDTTRWANELRVSCHALSIALKNANLIDAAAADRMRGMRVPREAKVDPELPDTLNPSQRERKIKLIELGLSDFYVGLCFDAFDNGVISMGRLAEAMLSSQAELGAIADIYGRSLHGH